MLFIALAAPFLVITVLRINAAMVFLSLCLGYVLVDLVAKDAHSLIQFLTPGEGSFSETTWHLIILFTPVVLTCILTIFSVKDRWRSIFNLLPAAATSVLMVLLTVPLLMPGLRSTLQSQDLWRQLNKAQALTLMVGAFLSLMFLWSQRKTVHNSKK